MTAMGLAKLNVPYAEQFIGATTAIVYRFNPQLWGGMGAGALNYSSGVLAPVFLHGRYYFDLKVVSLFASGEAGLLAPVSGTETPTRIYANPAVGGVILKKPTVMLTAAAGLFSQWGIHGHRDSFLNFKVGIAIY